MTELTIKLDGLDLTVEVTHLINDAPDPTCRDSADDFRGTREVEWHLTYATEYDDNGRVSQCGQLQKWLDRLAARHFDEIEAGIWAAYEKGQEAEPHE